MGPVLYLPACGLALGGVALCYRKGLAVPTLVLLLVYVVAVFASAPAGLRLVGALLPYPYLVLTMLLYFIDVERQVNGSRGRTIRTKRAKDLPGYRRS